MTTPKYGFIKFDVCIKSIKSPKRYPMNVQFFMLFSPPDLTTSSGQIPVYDRPPARYS